MDETDADRLTLLDRIAERLPDLDLDQHAVDWTEVPDGAEALVVDGGGLDGGSGVLFANAPNGDLHAVGSLAPAFPTVGCIVVGADGSRRLAQVQPDPLAEPPA